MPQSRLVLKFAKEFIMIEPYYFEAFIGIQYSDYVELIIKLMNG